MPQDPRDMLLEFRFESTLCGLDADALLRLARQSWRHNLAAGISGEMRVNGTDVSQVVEGRMEVVLPLAAGILADARHTGLRVQAFSELAARRHSGWRVHGLPAETQVRGDQAPPLGPMEVERARMRVAGRRSG